MRKYLILASLLLCGCSSIPTRHADLEVPEAIRRDGLGSICPVGPRQAYTAYHVVILYRPGAVYFIPLVWATADRSGSAYPLYGDSRRDLAVLLSDTDFPGFYPRAKESPKVGDELTVTGFDWKRDGLPRKTKKVKVTGTSGGSIWTDDTLGPGSSGSCLVNAHGEAVGVHHWGFTDAKIHTGVAAAIWGEWGTIPIQWQDREVPGWTGHEQLIPKENR